MGTTLYSIRKLPNANLVIPITKRLKWEVKVCTSSHVSSSRIACIKFLKCLGGPSNPSIHDSSSLRIAPSTLARPRILRYISEISNKSRATVNGIARAKKIHRRCETRSFPLSSKRKNPMLKKVDTAVNGRNSRVTIAIVVPIAV